MLDILLESTRIVFISIITATVWNAGKQPDIRLQPGWSFIFTGFLLLLFAMLIDVTDHFPGLYKFLAIGDTYYQGFPEKQRDIYWAFFSWPWDFGNGCRR